MIAIVDAYRAGLLKYQHWWSNLLAGVIVGVVALPLAMAFAIASGVKPEQGLYTAIIAALFVGIFGGSRVQIAGPTGAFIVILANITAQYGVEGLQIATLLAGFILIFMGFIRLGNVIQFIPAPVIIGFTSGVGFIIFMGEWKDFFGLTLHTPLDANLFQKLIAIFQAFPNLDFATTALAFLSLSLMLITPKIFKRIPGSLLAMVIVTTIQAIFHFKTVATLGSTFGVIPQHLPRFHLPTLSMNSILILIGPAFTIALLGAIESLLSATVAESMEGSRYDSNQELIGQGLANIVAPLLGGFAATGAIARTATNIRNGGNSPISAIVHSIVLLLVILLFAPLAANIPLCTLAAILFIVSYNMSDVPQFIRIIKSAPRYDIVILLTTFFLTIFTNLVIAVNVGVVLAMLFFIRRMTQSIEIETQSSPDDTLIFNFQGPLFFGVAKKLEHALQIANKDPKRIILRLKDVPFMDITCLQTLSEIISLYQKRGIKIYLTEANARILKKLKNTGILNMIEDQKVFDTAAEILRTELKEHVVLMPS